MDKKERNSLIISWITLSLAFAIMIIQGLWGQFSFYVSLLISFFSVGTGFIFHELAHRFTARKFGFHAEFILWKAGLALALILPIITFGRLLFAAPGAVYIFGNNISRKENGLISAAGPASNILFSAIFYFIALFILGGNGLPTMVFYYAAQINAFLGFFNLLPILILDGTKVMQWNISIWGLMIAIAGILAFFI